MRIDVEINKYLNAEVVESAAPCVGTIDAVQIEQVGINEQMRERPVIYLAGDFPYPGKGIVLNTTNAKFLIALFGAETDAWKGKTVRLTVEPVSFMGKIVKGIRFSRAE